MYVCRYACIYLPSLNNKIYNKIQYTKIKQFKKQISDKYP